MLFSKRAQEMKGSPTVMWDMKVREAMLENPAVINSTVGQPDFDMPECLRVSVEKALEMPGVNKYANPQGEEKLREAVVKFLKKTSGLDYASREIIWTSSKEAISLALSILLDDGDEVIINTPCWPTYIDLVRYCGGKPVLVETDGAFHLKPEAIKSAVTEKTKIIILNSPNNPTGAVYAPGELESVREIAVKNDLVVISDEVYRTIVFGENKHCSISTLSGMKERTIVVDGFSKSFAVPGFRIGFAAGPEDVIKKMKELKSNVSGNSDSLMQYGVMIALDNYAEAFDYFMEEARGSFQERAVLLSEALSKSGIEFVKPQGAFYLFVKLPEKNRDSLKFAHEALGNGLGITPGIFFEKEGYARISFAMKEEKIEQAAKILGKILSSD